MLLNHEGVFHDPGVHNRIAWDTKLLLTAVLASLVNCIGLCQIRTEVTELFFPTALTYHPSLSQLPTPYRPVGYRKRISYRTCISYHTRTVIYHTRILIRYNCIHVCMVWLFNCTIWVYSYYCLNL